MARRHALTVIYDCQLRLAAHGREWVIPWDDFDELDDDEELACPKCGSDLTPRDIVNYGVCYGEHTSN